MIDYTVPVTGPVDRTPQVCPNCKASADLIAVVPDIQAGQTYRVSACKCGKVIWNRKA
jgi:hypothetical protein